MKKYSHLQIHGHRGCRGLLPENTSQAFIHAAELGVDAIEMDVVMTGDKKILVSHEPYMSAHICKDKQGNPISAADEKKFNIYKLSYEEIIKFDCGSKQHPSFPHQKNFPSTKPLFKDVILAINDIQKEILFNIEIKSDPLLYPLFQPGPEILADAVMEIIYEMQIADRCLLQSFDPQVLKHLHKNYPQIKCALLVEDCATPDKDIDALNFKPFGYNPHYKLITREIIDFCKMNNIQILAWTVNKEEDMLQMAQTGVDGIITDYPDRAVRVLR